MSLVVCFWSLDGLGDIFGLLESLGKPFWALGHLILRLCGLLGGHFGCCAAFWMLDVF